jgi:hypothetical protein
MERRIKQKEIKNAKRKDVVTADRHSDAADKHGEPRCDETSWNRRPPCLRRWMTKEQLRTAAEAAFRTKPVTGPPRHSGGQDGTVIAPLAGYVNLIFRALPSVSGGLLFYV